jgi:hypothetical protein
MENGQRYLVLDYPINAASAAEVPPEAAAQWLNQVTADEWELVAIAPLGAKHRYWFRSFPD